jgi:hypothetical protein
MPTADGHRAGASREAGGASPGRLLARTGARRTATSTPRRTRRRFTMNWPTCCCTRWRAQQPAVVQHRAQLGVRHQRPAQGHWITDPATGEVKAGRRRLHPSPAARLLHPGVERRPGQSRRHHGPVDARSAPVQVRQRHGHQLLEPAGEGEKLSGGGKSSGLMSWLKIGDRAAGAIKSGRHHPPRREDGLPRRRPSRHRGVRQLEGPRGTQGRGDGRGPQAPRRRQRARLADAWA